MADKIFRDPLYNYVSIDRREDGWLLELLDTPEIQRLRRIHQLGVSHFTYPGAEHTRFSHSLGVLHLMQQALQHAKASGFEDAQVRRAREPLLAAALLHDVGHGPFSHLFEPCLGTDHESWTCRIIESDESKVHEVLKRHNITPGDVAALIEEVTEPRTAWMRTLISSQLDVDRLDYLRRDSLFTGAGYGHYDYFRLLHTFQLHDGDRGYRDLVWTDKAVYAIEEYVFSRFYMYQNVYMHKTTRGYEKVLHKMWERAKSLRSEGRDVRLVGPIDSFWRAAEPTLKQYLALEEFVVLSQIQLWAEQSDPALSDLARRFLHRQGFICIEGPQVKNPLDEEPDAWEVALTDWVAKHTEYQPADAYVLRDNFETQVYSAYTPEPDTEDASPMNAIRVVRSAEEGPVEISQVLTRLQAVTNKAAETTRYYVPRELREEARKLREQWKS